MLAGTPQCSAWPPGELADQDSEVEVKACTVVGKTWTVTENVCLRAERMSTERAVTEGGVGVRGGDGLVLTIPPRIP